MNIPQGRPLRVVINTAFEINQETRGRVEQAIKQSLGGEAEIEYRVTPEIISGIEMIAGSFKLVWSIQSYLDEFQKELSKEIEQTATTE